MRNIILLALLCLTFAASSQTLEKTQAIAIYDVVPTIAPCTYCSERAYVRADSTEYRWQESTSSWVPWSEGYSYSYEIIQDSIIVTYNFEEEIDRDTVRTGIQVSGNTDVGTYRDFISVGQSRAAVANPEGEYEIHYQGDRVKVWNPVTDDFETATEFNNAFPNGGGNSAQWVIAQRWALDEPVDTVRYLWTGTGSRDVGCWTEESGDQGAGVDNECIDGIISELDLMPDDFLARSVFVQQGESDGSSDPEWLQKWAGVLINLRTHPKVDDNAVMIFSPFIESMTNTPWRAIDSLLKNEAEIFNLPIYASDERLYDDDLGVTNHPNNYAYTLTGNAMYSTFKDQRYVRPSRIEEVIQVSRKGFINPALNNWVLKYDSGLETIQLEQNVASEVTVTPSGNLGSTTVQAALVEHQNDIDALASGAADGVITSANYNISTHAIDVVVAPPGSSFSIPLSGIAQSSDIPTLLSQLTNDVPFLSSEVDGSTTNEIQTIDVFQLVGTNLLLSLQNDGEINKVIDMSSLQDGTGTDDQNADEVVVTPVGNMVSATVQAALEEHQNDIDALASGAADGVATGANYNQGTELMTVNMDLPAADFDVDLSKLSRKIDLVNMDVDINGYGTSSELVVLNTGALTFALGDPDGSSVLNDGDIQTICNYAVSGDVTINDPTTGGFSIDGGTSLILQPGQCVSLIVDSVSNMYRTISEAGFSSTGTFDPVFTSDVTFDVNTFNWTWDLTDAPLDEIAVPILGPNGETYGFYVGDAGGPVSFVMNNFIGTNFAGLINNDIAGNNVTFGNNSDATTLQGTELYVDVPLTEDNLLDSLVAINPATKRIHVVSAASFSSGVLYSANGDIEGTVGDSKSVTFSAGIDLSPSSVIMVGVPQVISGSPDNGEKLLTFSVDYVLDQVTVESATTLESGEVIRVHIAIH